MTPRTDSPRGLAALRAVYALQYAGAGLWIPYLAPFLEAAGVSGATQGLLFAMRNATFVVTQPLLGVLADRVGIGRVLRLSAVLAALTWLLLLRSTAPAALVGAFLLMAVGASAVAPLVDAAVISTLEGPGGERAGGPRAYARSRIWGSIGFAVAALLFGIALRGDTAGSGRAAILVVAVFQSSAALLAVALVPSRGGSVRPPSFVDAGRILRNRGVALVLLAGALHWITMAPYHTFFGAHVEHHGGGPMTIGLSITVSIVVELVVMATAPRWLSLLPPRRVLALSSAAGILRWSVTAVGSPAVIVAAQALHGLSYAGFYLAMVDTVVRRTAPEHRATAQALTASIALGIGTLAGNLLAGPLYDVDHGRTLFLAAAAFSVVPALVALAVPPAERAGHGGVQDSNELPARS